MNLSTMKATVKETKIGGKPQSINEMTQWLHTWISTVGNQQHAQG